MLPRSAHADTEAFALSWSPGEPPCVAPKALEDEVATKLGRNPFVAPERADVVLDGRELPAVAGRLRARVEQRDREGALLGSRELTAASCAELLESAAFVLVLIVDPDALLREAGPGPPKVTSPSRARVAHVRARRPPLKREQSPRRAPPVVHSGAGIAFSKGLLPGGGVAGLVTLGLTPWSLPVRFEWRGSYHISLEAPRGGAFSALAQEWRACLVVRATTILGGSACPGAVWAAISPGSTGLSAGDPAPKGVFAPALALGPTLRAGPFELSTDVSVLFPQTRWAFFYVDERRRPQSTHELDRIVVLVTAGVAWAFN